MHRLKRKSEKKSKERMQSIGKNGKKHKKKLFQKNEKSNLEAKKTNAGEYI